MILAHAEAARSTRTAAARICKARCERPDPLHLKEDDMKYLIAIVVVIAIYIAIEYNNLNKMKNRIETAELELKKYAESGSEKDIDNAKKYMTAVIRDYNNKVESFPSKIVADMFSFPSLHSDGFDTEA